MKGKVIMKALGMVSLLAAGFIVAGCSDVISATVPPSIEGEGTTLFIVYDDSGSMADSVLNAQGKEEAKCDIADRALISVGKRFDAYLAANPNRTLGVGIVLLRYGRCELQSFKVLKGSVSQYFANWTRQRGGPAGGTPLGNAITMAAENMIGIKNVTNKHIVVLTDGGSNEGPNPQSVLPTIQKNYKKVGVDVGVHVVAFDVNEGVFAPLKQQGATVLGASNEVELNKQFDFILREKIMLEKEE
jgi:hypothetical protein